MLQIPRARLASIATHRSPSGVLASERKNGGLRADRLAVVAVGLWRTATKKPDRATEGKPGGLVGIYIGYECRVLRDCSDRQCVSSREGEVRKKNRGARWEERKKKGGELSRPAIEGRRSVSTSERSLTIRPIRGTGRLV